MTIHKKMTDVVETASLVRGSEGGGRKEGNVSTSSVRQTSGAKPETQKVIPEA